LTLDTGTAPKLVIQTLNASYNKRYYHIEVTSTLNTISGHSADQAVDLEIDIEKCLYTKLIDAPLPHLQYVIHGMPYPATEHTFAEFADTNGDCGARKYSIVTAPAGLFTLDEATRTVSVETQDINLVGTHTIKMKVELPDFPLLQESLITTFEITVTHICSTTVLQPVSLDTVTYVIDMPERLPTVYTLPEIEDSVEVDSAGTAYVTSCGLRDYTLSTYPDPKDLITDFEAATRQVTVHAQQGFTQLGIHDY